MPHAIGPMPTQLLPSSAALHHPHIRSTALLHHVVHRVLHCATAMLRNGAHRSSGKTPSRRSAVPTPPAPVLSAIEKTSSSHVDLPGRFRATPIRSIDPGSRQRTGCPASLPMNHPPPAI